jgi:hypothetical protein
MNLDFKMINTVNDILIPASDRDRFLILVDRSMKNSFSSDRGDTFTAHTVYLTFLDLL